MRTFHRRRMNDESSRFLPSVRCFWFSSWSNPSTVSLYFLIARTRHVGLIWIGVNLADAASIHMFWLAVIARLGAPFTILMQSTQLFHPSNVLRSLFFYPVHCSGCLVGHFDSNDPPSFRTIRRMGFNCSYRFIQFRCLWLLNSVDHLSRPVSFSEIEVGQLLG